MEYDAVGRQTKVVLPHGGERRFSYNLAGDLLRNDRGPEGTKEYRYDSLGRQIETIDANGRSRKLAYDKSDRIIRMENEMGQPVSYTHDANGNRLALIDANGNTSTYVYDRDNKVVSLTYPAVTGQPENIERYAYDGAGRVVRKTRPNGDKIRFLYDYRQYRGHVPMATKLMRPTFCCCNSNTLPGGTPFMKFLYQVSGCMDNWQGDLLLLSDSSIDEKTPVAQGLTGVGELEPTPGFEPGTCALRKHQINNSTSYISNGYMSSKDSLSCGLTVSHDNPPTSDHKSNSPPLPPDLIEIVTSWPTIPEAIKRAVKAVVAPYLLHSDQHGDL